MKKQRRVPAIVVAIILIPYLLFLSIATLSHGYKIIDTVMALTGQSAVRFAEGKFPAASESISVVLHEGETELLSGFTDLRSADFSGSACSREIYEWSRSHPETAVTYTVGFPNGTTVGSTASKVNLSGLRHEDMAGTMDLLECLPNLRSVDFGQASDSPALSAEDVSAVASAFPNAEISYSIDVLGRSYSLNDRNVDLSGLTSSTLADAISKLSLLKEIDCITLGKDSTSNGTLTWDDVSKLASAFPSAAISCDFTVCGQSASLADTSLDLRAITPADVDMVCKILPAMTQLEYVDIGDESSGISWVDIDRLYKAAPNAVFDYDITIIGKTVSLADEVFDFNHVYMPDNGAYLKSILPYAKNCKRLDMDFCGRGEEFNQMMNSIREEFPGIEVIWRIWFGENYSVRTNVTKILASKPSKGGKLYNDDVAQLRYCTNVRYLDLGHNDGITDFSFVASMPDLEIVVMSMCGVSDLTPFASCSHLKYIEAGNTKVGDLTPLASCKELRHLNIGTCPGVTDISPLYDIPLRRLWLGVNSGSHCTNYPTEQAVQYMTLHPECEVCTTCPTGYGNKNEFGDADAEGYTKEGWKFYQQYLTEDWNYYGRHGYFPAQRPLGYFKVVYKALDYNLGEAAYSFSWNDPKYEVHDDNVAPVNTKVIDTSLLDEEWHDIVDNVIPDKLDDPPGETLYIIDY